MLLHNAPILIVEDEPIIAMALGFAVMDAGGQVVGPASSVKAALELLETHLVSGAVLDVNLIDGVVSPVVYWLMQRHIPLILQTGIGIPADLAASFPNIIVHIKPNASDKLIVELADLIARTMH